MNDYYFEYVPDTDGLVFKKYLSWITQWHYRDEADRRFFKICTPAHKPIGEADVDIRRAVIDNFGDLVVVS